MRIHKRMQRITGESSSSRNTGNYSSRLRDARSTSTTPRYLPFDHILPAPALNAERPSRTAILYGSPLSKNFRQLHEPLYLASQGLSPHVEYVFRHAPSPSSGNLSQAPLSGYGVALDLKKMEYLALDDRVSGMLCTALERSLTAHSKCHGYRRQRTDFRDRHRLRSPTRDRPHCHADTSIS